VDTLLGTGNREKKFPVFLLAIEIFFLQRKNCSTTLRMICFLVYIIRTFTSIPRK
jgi:hypothetical protein